MIKRLGLVVAGVAVGIVLTELFMEQEKQREQEEAERKTGLFAEIDGNTVRMYEVKNGRFCGYTETKEFESQDQAMEWAVKETDAKIVIAGGQAQG